MPSDAAGVRWREVSLVLAASAERTGTGRTRYDLGSDAADRRPTSREVSQVPRGATSMASESQLRFVLSLWPRCVPLLWPRGLALGTERADCPWRTSGRATGGR